MLVSEFENQVLTIAREIGCDGGTRIASHKVRSSVIVAVDGDEDDSSEYELVGVEPSMMVGCGCWRGIVLRVRKTVPNIK